MLIIKLYLFLIAELLVLGNSFGYKKKVFPVYKIYVSVTSLYMKHYLAHSKLIAIYDYLWLFHHNYTIIVLIRISVVVGWENVLFH